MKHLRLILFAFLFFGFFQNCGTVQTPTASGRSIWTAAQANEWYGKQPWLVGCNYIPAYAINELEMWQAESFDTLAIDRELGWAAAIGINSIRVYLHDLLWQQDSTGFMQRMNTFLSIAERHHIKPLFVLFDSCWDPFPKLGRQHDPKPHVHNSGWVQSPGYEALKDSTQYPRLEKYVKGLVAHFAADNRILAWDCWNEPDNTNNSSYGKIELPDKESYVLPLLKKTFEWARSVNPSQPLTSGVWKGDWSSATTLSPMEKTQLEESDIISFHNYDEPAEFEKRIKWLLPYGRPIICTEYMARGNGSFFAGSLPLAKQYHVGAFNWGLVDGKTQTKYAWDSWDKQYDAPPVLWFHEIFQADGTPYKAEETELIKKLTASNTPKP